MLGISSLAYLGTHTELHNTAVFKGQICVYVCLWVERRLFVLLLWPCLTSERPCETRIIGHWCSYALCKHAQHTRLLHSLCGTDKRLKGIQRRFGLNESLFTFYICMDISAAPAIGWEIPMVAISDNSKCNPLFPLSLWAPSPRVSCFYKSVCSIPPVSFFPFSITLTARCSFSLFFFFIFLATWTVNFFVL